MHPATVPSHSSDETTAGCLQVQTEHAALLKALQQLWSERPGWLLPDMHERLSRVMTGETFQKTALDSILACYAYRFTHGATVPLSSAYACLPQRMFHVDMPAVLWRLLRFTPRPRVKRAHNITWVQARLVR